MKHSTNTLEGAQLDAAVAMALGLTTNMAANGRPAYRVPDFIDCPSEDAEFGDTFEPSTRWDHGGPIIDRERIGTEFCRDMFDPLGYWAAVPRDKPTHEIPHPDPKRHASKGWCPITATGPTPLIAAMRAYVASKFGDEVELP